TDPKVELARAARAAAGDTDDPLFDFVLAWEVGRAGSIAEATALLRVARRMILENPTRRDDPRELMKAADCSSWLNDAPGTCALYVQAVDRARELGLAGVVVQGLAELGGYQIDIGAWQEAEAGFAETVRLGEATGQL